MGIKVFAPYWAEKVKRAKTRLGEFEIESFDLPHNGTENRGFLIKVDGTTICYLTDLEYCGWDLSSKEINVMLIELNYQTERIVDMDNHRQHTVLGHSEEKTTIGIIENSMKHLRNVILCHMSNSGALDRELAMKNIREVIPAYISVEWAVPGQTYDISEIPF
jgi:hypothetical protein